MTIFETGQLAFRHHGVYLKLDMDTESQPVTMVCTLRILFDRNPFTLFSRKLRWAEGCDRFNLYLGKAGSDASKMLSMLAGSSPQYVHAAKEVTGGLAQLWATGYLEWTFPMTVDAIPDEGLVAHLYGWNGQLSYGEYYYVDQIIKRDSRGTTPQDYLAAWTTDAVKLAGTSLTDLLVSLTGWPRKDLTAFCKYAAIALFALAGLRVISRR